MMDRVLELLAEGWVVEVGSYYGSHVVEDAEEIRDTFEEVEAKNNIETLMNNISML